jgi:hypothetical protein
MLTQLEVNFGKEPSKLVSVRSRVTGNGRKCWAGRMGRNIGKNRGEVRITFG